MLWSNISQSTGFSEASLLHPFRYTQFSFSNLTHWYTTSAIEVVSVNNLKTASYDLLECDTMLRFQVALFKIKVFKYLTLKTKTLQSFQVTGIRFQKTWIWCQVVKQRYQHFRQTHNLHFQMHTMSQSGTQHHFSTRWLLQSHNLRIIHIQVGEKWTVIVAKFHFKEF